MGALSPTHWAIIVIVVLLLFGAKKLPDMARGMGQSLRIFKAETQELRNDGTKADGAETTATPQTPAVEPGSTTPSTTPSSTAQASAPQTTDTTPSSSTSSTTTPSGGTSGESR